MSNSLPSKSKHYAPSTLVDQGLSLLQFLDRDLVANFLLRRGVRFAVIVRVLNEPMSRRNRERSLARQHEV